MYYHLGNRERLLSNAGFLAILLASVYNNPRVGSHILIGVDPAIYKKVRDIFTCSKTKF